MTLKTGDAIFITYEGRTLAGHVLLASTNGKSIFLEFEGLLGGFLGSMPVLLGEDGVYRDLVKGHEVTISTSAEEAREDLLEKAVTAAWRLGLATAGGSVLTVDPDFSEVAVAITVWKFKQAPSALRDLSTSGGDEDWIMYLPPGVDVPAWAETGAFDSGMAPDMFELPNGAKVVIGCHA